MAFEINEKVPVVDLLYPTTEKRFSVINETTKISAYEDDYITNLEVENISRLICPDSPSHAKNLLTQFCTDVEVIRYRQDILEDFLNVPQLEAVLYNSIHTLYVNERTNISRLGVSDSFFSLSTRLNSLKTYIKCINDCHEFCVKFGGKVKSEAVKKLVEYFESVYGNEDFKEVEKEVDICLDMLAKGVKSVTIGINFDEMMRPVEASLISVSTEAFKEKKRFDWIFKHVQTDVVRAISKNHKLYDDEGMENPLEIPLFRELKEINSEYVYHLDMALKAYFKRHSEDILSLEHQLDFYVGAKKLIESVRKRGLPVCRPEILPKEDRISSFKNMFDLSFYKKLVAKDPDKSMKNVIVTNDCEMDENGRFFVLTGANNGGKTTYVRGVGICQLLAQAGIYVPAESAKISPVDYIYTHFPKEEEVGLDTSRFTQECKQFKTTIDTATKYSMLLLNESIQSTTPTECVYIAEELVKIFRCVGVRGLYATHLLELARNVDKINEEVKGDTKIVSIVTGVDTNDDNRRTYKISRGEPAEVGYARTIYEKFGVSFEDVKKRVEKNN